MDAVGSGDDRGSGGSADTDNHDRISDNLQHIPDLGQQRHQVLRPAQDHRGDAAAASQDRQTAGDDALCGRLPGRAGDRISGGTCAYAGDNGVDISRRLMHGREHVACDIHRGSAVFDSDGIHIMLQTGPYGFKGLSGRSREVCRSVFSQSEKGAQDI